jgi:hypothetical protein
MDRHPGEIPVGMPLTIGWQFLREPTQIRNLCANTDGARLIGRPGTRGLFTMRARASHDDVEDGGKLILSERGDQGLKRHVMAGDNR